MGVSGEGAVLKARGVHRKDINVLEMQNLLSQFQGIDIAHSLRGPSEVAPLVKSEICAGWR